MVPPCDWQTTKQKVAQRGQHLLETGQWSDCKFIVGQEPHQEVLEGHKIFLAMSSPVFEAMFYGSMAEKNEPIPIRDVQPEAFKALMEYIYTDRVDLASFELACELCYCAKKYMLPYLVEECTTFLWSDLSLKKACRAYEFAKLFEEPVLMDKCLQMICSQTDEVILESSWDEVELGTILTILDQEELHISSEIDLFDAIERWAKAECSRKSIDLSDPKALRSVVGNALCKIRFLTLTPQQFAEGPGKSPLLMQQEAFAILMNISSNKSELPMPEGFSEIPKTRSKMKVHIHDARKYRFNPKRNIPQHSYSVPQLYSVDCSTGIGGSFNLNQPNYPVMLEDEDDEPRRESKDIPNEIHIINIRDRPKFYCTRSIIAQNNFRNNDVMDCSVSFTVDRNIFVLGVQVPSQTTSTTIVPQLLVDRTYTEVLYAHLLDSDGTRLTYTHYRTKASLRELVEISFNQSVYIQKNKIYKIGIVFNKPGWYPIGSLSNRVHCENVSFTFNVGANGLDFLRDGLIRSIVYTHN